MNKLIVSLDGLVIKEVALTKDRTRLGRRPHNDIVIDNLAVSGEHAVLQQSGEGFVIEDLNSTNGTYINGKAIRRQALVHGDVVEIGKYRLRFVAAEATDYETTVTLRQAPATRAGETLPALAAPVQAQVVGALSASVRVLNGSAAGREVQLSKVVTTLGKPGVQVAAITKRPGGYLLTHIEGAARPRLNGEIVWGEPVHLSSGDLIELAGTQMQFILEG